MLTRYTTSRAGKPIKQANVYTKDEHNISREAIDNDAIKIIRRLKKFGYNAYIVGGAVRDLLLGKKPKDFDIVTEAKPHKIRKVFKNSRIIGKRFRLVHIFFKQKIIEVSTFRSGTDSTFNNNYGSIEQDVWRRDFTINALFYCPLREIVVDYVGGYEDLKNRSFKTVIPLRNIFSEDPVRMIRAVKYSCITNFALQKPIRKKIQKEKEELQSVSSSRLTEEVFKILQSGVSSKVFIGLDSLGLLHYIMPRLAELLVQEDMDTSFREKFYRSLEELDAIQEKRRETRKSFLLLFLLGDYIYYLQKSSTQGNPTSRELFLEAKNFLTPLTPPNREIEAFLNRILHKRKPHVRKKRTQERSKARRT